MRITEIRMFVCDEIRLRATLTLTFEGVFVVKGVKIIDGRHGMFVAMPSRRTNGGFEDICHPVNTDFREYVETEVLREYARIMNVPFAEIEARRRRPSARDSETEGVADEEEPDAPREARPRGDRESDGGVHPSA